MVASGDEVVEFSSCIKNEWGPRWRSWLRHSATNRKVAGSVPDGVIVRHYVPGVDSASNRNEYREYFLGR
jgi:hypothetical protein